MKKAGMILDTFRVRISLKVTDKTAKIAKIYSLWWAGGARGVFWRAFWGYLA